MTGCLRQRGEVFYIRIKYKGEDDKIKEKWVSTGFSGKGAKHKAELKIDEILDEYAYLEKSQHPTYMSSYLKMWKEKQKANVSISTYEGYETYIDVHLAPYFEKLGLTLQQITPRHIVEYVEYLSNPGSRKDHRNTGYSWASIRKLVSLLHRVFDYAVMCGEIKFNPATGVKIPHVKSGQEAQPVFLSIGKAQELLDAFRGEELGPLVYTTIYYGLRKSEVLGLRWSAVDFEKNTIRINYTVVKNKTIVEKEDTKSYTSRRTFELLPDVRNILLKLKEKEAEYRETFGAGYVENDFVFKWSDGTPYRPDGITRSFQRTLTKHGLPPMRFHDLRHSTASILIDKGWDINDIRDWLGHADIDTTANIYAHISHEHRVSLAQNMNETFKFSID